MDVRLFLSRLLFACTIAGLCIYAAAKPVQPKKEPPKRKAEPVPTLIAECQWGKIVQDGRRFTITGSPSWSGDGEISKDGKLAVIQWVRFPEGVPAIGVYAIDKGEMIGAYSYNLDAEKDAAGLLVEGVGEHLRAVP